MLGHNAAVLGSIKTLLEIGTRTHPCTSKKHGNRQTECCGQFFHTRIVPNNKQVL